jgi:hypothetical protein
MDNKDKLEIEQAGALALDILEQRLHLPMVDGMVNRERIEDKIVIGLYAGHLQPVSQAVVDLAVDAVQDMCDMQRGIMGDNWDGE